MFKKWKYVYAVYEEGNFTEAAKKLFISQPSLSAAIKKTEEQLGAPLFERTGSRVLPTEIGREYIEAAKQMRQIENNFMNKLNDIYNIESGALTVGGTNYLSSYILPRIVNKFSQMHPHIDVTLVEANSINLRDMIQNEKVDVVIDSFDESMNAYQGYPLVCENILLCVPKNRKINDTLKSFQISADDIANKRTDFAQIPCVDIENFKEENFILLKDGNDMYERAMYIFEEAGIFPRISFSVDQLNISYALATEGMGLCFATDTLIRYGNVSKDIVLYKTGMKNSARMLYVAYKKNRYCSRAMAEFIRIAENTIGE